jgi:hypothetical protein
MSRVLNRSDVARFCSFVAPGRRLQKEVKAHTTSSICLRKIMLLESSTGRQRTMRSTRSRRCQSGT